MGAVEQKVWDPFVRLFHWALVLFFVIAFASGDELAGIHSIAGYALAVLVAARLIWGVIGTRHARFTDFVYKPRVITHYLKQLAMLRAPRYIGHNPAGGAMVILLLIMLSVASITGIAALGASDHSGPLAAYLHNLSRWQIKLLKEFHEVVANSCLMLVFVHVAGVIIESMLHEENLVRSMVTGKKRI